MNQKEKEGIPMIKIVICDDDDFTVKFISELLAKAVNASKVSAKIVCKASSGTDILHFLQKTSDSFLYFLDFDFGKKELNGIDLVKKIYQYDPAGKIVFVTSHGEKGIPILQSGIQAFGFIEKNPNQQIMTAACVKYLKMADSRCISISESPMLELPIGIDETISLPLSDILYVDSVKIIAHSICYHTFDGSEITIRDTMEHALELLGSGFIRCHRSVIVNKKQVVSIKNGLIRLSNGVMVTCAINRRKEIMELCLKNN